MRTIIAGSRSLRTAQTIRNTLARLDWNITTILSGTARGADLLGEQVADELGIPVETHPAEWDRFGKSAGYRRNELMATKADAAIIFWDGESKGSKHMIDLALKHGLIVLVIPFTPGV